LVVPERLKGLRTLIVDDLPVNIEILKQQLQALGMDIQIAHDGFEAIAEMERAWSQGRLYDLVLLDQMMPGIAGVSLAERVRATPNFAETRMVLISSAGDVELRRGAGRVIDAVLEKPIRRADLLECLSRLFVTGTGGCKPAYGAADGADPAASSGGDKEGKADTTPKVARGLRVLLAEDNKVNQEVALVMLRKAGHSVHVVDNGLEAVEAASAEMFDIVLMDVQMPLLDGIEATKKIRELPGPRGRVRVVALTADAMTGAKEYYLKVGMDDYLAKPIKAADLRAKLAESVPAGATCEGVA
jgi:CheY-like chemotaxis protein